MTDKRPFTLTITNGNRGSITAAPVKETPKADNANREADRLSNRADLAVAYAGLLGVSSARSDMLDTLKLQSQDGTSDKVEASAIATCLRTAGLQAQVVSARAPGPDHWPALAYMTSGQVVLVVGQDRDDLIIYDKTCPDNRAHVPLAEFMPFFAGLLVKAEAPLSHVAETHKTFQITNHWFWGQFPRFRKALGEVALGSFVANLLAVAVALFSLQVYDRVIPHQSEATLWVLAAGACLALLRLLRGPMPESG